MNMEEYKKRIENAHTFTGIPSYWEQFQDALSELEQVKAERDNLIKIIESLKKEN